MAKGQQKPQQRGPLPDDRKIPGSQNKKIRPPVIHGDLYQRANFTLQASAFLQQLQAQPILETARAPTSDTDTSFENDECSFRAKQEPDYTRLSRNIMAANGKMVIHNQMKL